MYNITESLYLFLPEIVMVLGSMLVLMLGAFGSLRIANTFAIAVLAFAAFMVLYGPSHDVKAFGGMMHLNAFVKYGKILITFASTFVLLLMFSEKRQFELLVLVLLSTAGMMFMI